MFGTTLELAKVYQKQLLEEARKARKPEKAAVHFIGLQEQLATRLGGLLVSAGLRLQERYSPSVRPTSEACQVC